MNLRRGDYFAAENRVGFVFDQDAYLKVAVPRAFESARPARIRVVSDALDLCRARLGWLNTHSEQVEWSEGWSLAADFRALAAAGHLIITNSTFSYWGRYVREVVNPEGTSAVGTPRFFHRTIPGGAHWPMPPEWSIVEDIPGGWDS